MGEGVEKTLQLTIRNALLHFCFAERVEDVSDWEEHFSSQELAELGYPNLGATSNRPTRVQRDPRYNIDYRKNLALAWAELLLDLRQRLERGDIVVTGVRTRPDPTEVRAVIPGQWATDFKIDALNNTIEFRQTRYVAIRIGLPGVIDQLVGDLTRQPAQDPPSMIPLRLTAETVRELSDDEVLTLLEEHFRRVLEKPGAKLISPGRISFAPILLRKLHHRHVHGEMCSVLADETAALESWLKTKVTGYQLPGRAAIENICRVEYRNLKHKPGP